LRAVSLDRFSGFGKRVPPIAWLHFPANPECTKNARYLHGGGTDIALGTHPFPGPSFGPYRYKTPTCSDFTQLYRHCRNRANNRILSASPPDRYDVEINGLGWHSNQKWSLIWRLFETPDGPISKGRYKLCGEERNLPTPSSFGEQTGHFSPSSLQKHPSQSPKMTNSFRFLLYTLAALLKEGRLRLCF